MPNQGADVGNGGHGPQRPELVFSHLSMPSQRAVGFTALVIDTCADCAHGRKKIHYRLPVFHMSDLFVFRHHAFALGARGAIIQHRLFVRGHLTGRG